MFLAFLKLRLFLVSLYIKNNDQSKIEKKKKIHTKTFYFVDYLYWRYCFTIINWKFYQVIEASEKIW